MVFLDRTPQGSSRFADADQGFAADHMVIAVVIPQFRACLFRRNATSVQSQNSIIVEGSPPAQKKLSARLKSWLPPRVTPEQRTDTTATSCCCRAVVVPSMIPPVNSSKRQASVMLPAGMLFPVRSDEFTRLTISAWTGHQLKSVY